MRQFTRVMKTPLTLLALTALVTFGGIWGYRNAVAEIPPRPPEPCVMTNVGGVLTPNYVTVRTLNAGLNGGLAKRASTTLRSHGFYILKVNNSEQRMSQTVVVGNSKDDPEVKLVAGYFKNAKRAGDGRIDHVVDVLLGDDFAGYQENPKGKIAVPGDVCLPALPASEVTATASPTANASATATASPTTKASPTATASATASASPSPSNS